MKERFKLFSTGFVQVILVCLNTYQIANYIVTKSLSTLIGILFVGFLISLIWTLNVKKVAFGSWVDRVTYASGASLGSVVGVLIGEIIY